MRTWQIVAGITIVVLVAVGANFLRKSHSPDRVLFVLLLVPVPTAGFATFALAPGSPPTFTIVTVVVAVLIVLAVRPAFYLHMETKGWRGGGTKTIKDLDTLNRFALAHRGCGLLGVTGFLYMFEPGFALANLAIILVWTAIWIPRGRRALRYDFSAEVRADSKTAYRFMIEPANLGRSGHIEFVRADPEGPMAVGTVVTLRTLVSSTGEPADGFWVHERWKTVDMTATSFTRESLDRNAKVVSEVRSNGSEAIVKRRVERVNDFAGAVLGSALESRRQVSQAQESFRQAMDSMNKAIGVPLSPAG